MSDKNLSDDMVKLVQWSLVSVKRDGERVFRDGEDLVTENLTPDGFTAWVVRKYGCDAVPLNDAMYIRVYYNVLDRWPKQDLHYESRQLRVLERIADCVCYDAHRDDRGEEDRRGRRPAEEEAAVEGEGVALAPTRQGRRAGAPTGGTPTAP